MSSGVPDDSYAIPSRRGRVLSDLAPRLGTTDSSAAGDRIGSLATPGGAPTIGTVTSSRTFAIGSGITRGVVLQTLRSPYRLEIHVEPTFSPADYGLRRHHRQLGAQAVVTS